jgi:hypothetical protein
MNKVGLTAGLVAALVISASSLAADDAITLPAGSELHVQLITTLTSKTNDTGDMWTGKVVEPIFGRGGEIVPDGSTVDGHITFIKGDGKGKGKGEMQLVADSISTPDSSKYDLAANPENAQGAGQGKDIKGTAAETGIDADARAFVPKKKAKEIVLPQGTEVTFVISRETVAKKVMPH